MILQTKVRRDKTANWTNVVLTEGELGYDSEKDELKIGNTAGTQWQSRGAIGGGKSQAEIEKFESEIKLSPIVPTSPFKITYQGTLIVCKNTAAITLNLFEKKSTQWGAQPASEPKEGCTIDIVQWTTNPVEIKAEAGVTIISTESLKKLRVQGSAATLVFIAPATNEWLLVGDLG